MPQIEDFGDFTVYMYYETENPPHFHLVAPDWQAKVEIATLEIIAGRAPVGVMRRVRRWAGTRKPFLMRKWNEYTP